MAQATDPALYDRYRDTFRRRVCAVCLDSRDDGSCGLSAARRCAIEEHLPLLVEALRTVRSGRMDEYAAALESEVCRRCSTQDDQGVCRLRNRGECALAVYLPLIVDAIDEVGS